MTKTAKKVLVYGGSGFLLSLGVSVGAAFYYKGKKNRKIETITVEVENEKESEKQEVVDAEIVK